MRNRSSLTEDRREIRQDLVKDEKITPEEATNASGVGMFQVKLVILSGIIWIARGFEMVIIQSVAPLMACTWNLKHWHGAVLSTVTLISTILGCLLYGLWSDKYGRRMALSSSLTFLFVFGAVSAGLPNYTWFTIFRAVAGFSVGGFSQTLVLCFEFFPIHERGRAIYILSCFGDLGATIILWVLYITMESENGWRLFVAIGTLPAFLATCLMRFYPESFRYLMVIDKYFAANDIMTEMTEANGKKVTAQLLHLPQMRRRRLILDFFRMPFVRSSILLWLMGFVTSISYLGLEYLTPQFVHKGAGDVVTGDMPMNISSMNFMGDMHEPIVCMNSMPQETFIYMVWTTALDFPSFVIYMILVDVINRKILLSASYILSSLCIFLLFIPSLKDIFYIVFIYCARTLLHGQHDLILLMVVETFPTSHRGTAVGFQVAIFYLSQFLSSYINQGLLLSHKIMFYFILYGGLTFICSLACWGLKHETRGKELQDIIRKPSEGNIEDNNRETEETMRTVKFTRTANLQIHQ